MRYRFVTTDVFTDRIFGGNPLAVLPDGRGLSTGQMQAVAREFNLSETVFVLPPADPAHTRELRIFTPAREVPFAGHPTIGTALVLAAIGAIEREAEVTPIVFEEGAGPVPVTIRAPGSRPAFAESTAPEPPEVRPAPDPLEFAAMLALAPSDLRTEAGLPEMASCGLPFLIVELRDAAALGRVRLDRTVWQRLLADAWAREVYLITRDVAGENVDFRGACSPRQPASARIRRLAQPQRRSAAGSACARRRATGHGATSLPRVSRWVGRAGSRSRSSGAPARSPRSGSAATPFWSAKARSRCRRPIEPPAVCSTLLPKLTDYCDFQSTPCSKAWAAR